jgi:hypothetical protein
MQESGVAGGQELQNEPAAFRSMEEINPKVQNLASFSSSSSSFVLDEWAFSAAKRARLSRNFFVPLF